VSNPEALRQRERALAGQSARGVRPVIRESWLRARAAGVHPDRYVPPVALPGDLVEEQRERHPLATAWPALCTALQWVTRQPAHLLFVSDAEGHLLWVKGDSASMSHAEGIHLVPGALWSEQAAGTCGVGTALALQRPFQVLGPEHYLSAASRYACTAAPIHDPVTGTLLGAVDLACRLEDPAPLVMSLLLTAAHLAQSRLQAAHLQRVSQLRERYADRLTRRAGGYAALVAADGTVIHTNRPRWLPARLAPIPAEGEITLPSGRRAVAERLAGGAFLLTAHDSEPIDGGLRFLGLGRPRARLQVAGAVHDLSRRHGEIVAVLLANPGGLTAAELTRHVYGPAGKTVTLRAELTRLRAVLGHRLLSDPYRIAGPATADFLDFPQPDTAGAALLPGSSAPAVLALRRSPHGA